MVLESMVKHYASLGKMFNLECLSLPCNYRYNKWVPATALKKNCDGIVMSACMAAQLYEMVHAGWNRPDDHGKSHEHALAWIQGYSL